MATASVTNTFVNATTADATDVNQNFTDVVTFLNGSVLHLDGSKAMSGNLDASSNKIVNLTSGTADSDAVNLGQLNSVFPVGQVTMFAGSSAPSGWIFCDGQAINRTTYADLFAAISTTYGVGDGATTFNVPNLQGKFVIGESGSYALAATGGSANAVLGAHTHADSFGVTINSGTAAHTHSTPAHAHDLTSGNTNFWRVSGTLSGSTGSIMVFGSYVGRNNIGTESTDTGGSGTSGGASGSASHGHTGSVTGSVGAVNETTASLTNANMPPYIALNYIIRTGV